MIKHFGPWTTAADTGSVANLSTFWKRRLAMLPVTYRSSARLGGRAVVILLTAAALVWALPTLHIFSSAMTQAADEPQRESGEIASGHQAPIPEQISGNNMLEINLALANYMSKHGSFPPAYSVDKDGRPLLSWRVLILPEIHLPHKVKLTNGEFLPLYKAFRYDEPWDSPHNRKLLPYMPTMYWSPLSKPDDWKTNYLGISGRNTMFPGSKPVKREEIKDSPDRTIAIVEVNDDLAVEWTRPVDFHPDLKQPAKGLGNRPGQRRGFIRAGFLDGHVYGGISVETKPDLLWSLFIINDGKPEKTEF